MLKYIVLFIIIHSISCYAYDISIEDNSKAFKTAGYTVGDKISRKELKRKELIVRRLLNNNEYAKLVDFKIIISTHDIKEIYGVTSSRKVDDEYIIILTGSTYRTQETLLHELGHIIRFEHFELAQYSNMCYRGQTPYRDFEEEFAEDFKKYASDYEKTFGFFEHSKKFKYYFRSIIKK